MAGFPDITAVAGRKSGELERHRLLSVAPMMDWTDRHCRYFFRLLTPDALLYTEMVTAMALMHGDASRLLAFAREEHPVALQLGGSDPGQLKSAAVLGEQAGYDEINMNVGCPSARVSSGRFGACLMAEPERVADCVAAMNSCVAIPVTVKIRVGIDDQDSDGILYSFVERVAEAGCEVFIVHARKAILAGLSPKQNRSVPPLDYQKVYRLKREFPELQIIINGGISDIAQIQSHLAHVDGVMVGRHAYNDPYWLCAAQLALFPGVEWMPPERQEVVSKMTAYLSLPENANVKPHAVTRHMLGLFSGQPGGKAWRRYISENTGLNDSSGETLLRSLDVFAAQ